MEDKMKSRLVQSLQEAVAYAKGDKTKGYEAKIKVFEPVEIPEEIDIRQS